MRKQLALTLAALLLLSGAAMADDSDIFGSNIIPNVMILFDSSGSMNDSIASNPYDAAVTYPGSIDPVKVYKSSSGNWTVYANTVALVNSSSARTALNAVGYWSGRINGSRVTLRTGNYRNYQACSTCSATERKFDIAKRVVTGIVTNTEGVNFGVMKLASNGGSVVAEVGADPAVISSRVNSMSNSSVGTPTGDQLYDAGRYFKGNLGYTSPITQACQPNFSMIISDGLQNSYVHELASEASARFVDDHSNLTGQQNLIVHAVGFAIDPSESAAANSVLQAAATNGGGTFYSSNNSAELEAALQDAIRQIVSGSFSFASPLIPTTSAAGTTKAFLAAFQSDPFSPAWKGFLRAYQRGSDGLIPTDVDGKPLASAQLWEAGSLLAARSPGSRTIYTSVGGTRQALTTGNGSLTHAMFGVANDPEKDSIIDFVRGTDVTDIDRDGNISEDRPWKLGDIYHSSPVLIFEPPLLIQDASYQTFQTANAGRTPIILAGANDGMIHAFREADGVELWGFIPESLLPTLSDQMPSNGTHQYYVDSSPIALDINTSSGWKTVVVFGLRRGGRSVEALDITSTTNPLPLWSFTDAKLGETWSEPSLSRIEMADGTIKSVAFFGGGYDTDVNNATGKALFVVDMENGNLLWEYYNDGTGGDKQYMNFSMPASPTVIDTDSNGTADLVYIGDVGGQVWKFDVSAPATLTAGKVNNWTGRRLFAAAPGQANPPAAGEFYPAQAIYSPPSVAVDKAGNYWLTFGTGDRNHPLSNSSNLFAAIKDDGLMTNGSTYSPSDLSNVTSTNVVPTATGWYFTLGSTEKVLDSAEVFNDVTYFSSFTPNVINPCDSEGGIAKLYAVDLTSGYGAIDFSNGTSLGSSDSSTARSTTVGSGIPSSPIIVLQDSGGVVVTNVVLGTTSGELPSNPTPPPTTKDVLYWREVF